MENDSKKEVPDVPHPKLLIGKRKQPTGEDIAYSYLKAAYVQAAKVAEKKQSAIDRA